MVTSFYAECNDCKSQYRIRYGFGNSYPQSASFACSECSNQIEVMYEEFRGARHLKGAKVADHDGLNTSIPVVNLHPEIPISKGDEHNPIHFASLDFFSRWDTGKKDVEDLIELRQYQHNWTLFYRNWEPIKTSLRILTSRGEAQLKNITSKTLKEFTADFKGWASLFIQGEFQLKDIALQEEIERIDVSAIRNYAKNRPRLLKSVYQFCTLYMSKSQQFQSAYLDQIYGLPVENTAIPNVNWSDIESVYGDLYEILGDMFVIPTMMNNVKDGRAFDGFKTADFTLDKYLQTDKANRALNFSANGNLCFLQESYHSWLRNGTHHKNSSIDNQTREISLGTGKGGATERKIMLLDYIKTTNDLFVCGLVLSCFIIDAQT